MEPGHPAATTAVSMEEEEDDDEEFEETESGVELGFITESSGAKDMAPLLFEDQDWHRWDGGKIGGRPLWLNPRDLPATADMECGQCREPLAFLLLIYCPLDDVEGAFHRAMYVFSCHKSLCIQAGHGLKVLRCQLPQKNDFYPYEPSSLGAGTASGSGSSSSTSSSGALSAAEPASSSSSCSSSSPPTEVTLCSLCGQRASSSCSRCKAAFYCCRTHQRIHWKATHKETCGRAGSSSRSSSSASFATPALFKEFELEVAPEAELLAEEEMAKFRDEEALMGRHGEVQVEEAGEDGALSQRELDDIATGASGANAEKDPATLRFLSRVAAASGQVLRYSRWGAAKPLWCSSASVPKAEGGDIPPCPHCGSARLFEFQVMPQLLHFLGIEKSTHLADGAYEKALEEKLASEKQQQGQQQGEEEGGGGDQQTRVESRSGPEAWQGRDAIDWGTLAVFTCPKSCSPAASSCGYIEEVVWRQPPLG